METFPDTLNGPVNLRLIIQHVKLNCNGKKNLFQAFVVNKEPAHTSPPVEPKETECEKITNLKSAMTTLIDLNGDSKTLSDIKKELSVLKEKMRVLKDEISQSDERQQKGDAMIEKVKEKMSEEGEINIYTTALADKMMAFHKVHMSACDKAIMVRDEYCILAWDYSALQDDYIALLECTLPSAH